jgi:hypothetical protein
MAYFAAIDLGLSVAIMFSRATHILVGRAVLRGLYYAGSLDIIVFAVKHGLLFHKRNSIKTETISINILEIVFRF